MSPDVAAKRLRVVFCGSRDIGAFCLHELLVRPAEFEVVAIYGHADDVTTDRFPFLPITAVRTPPPELRSINEPEARPWQGQPIDALISVRYEHRIHANVLGLVPPERALNLHMGQLPQYAGSASVAHAILNDERVCEATLHVMTPNLDDGPVFSTVGVFNSPSRTAGAIHADLVRAAARMFADNIAAILRGHRTPRPMSTDGRQFYRRDALRHELDFSRDGAYVKRQIRALLYPGAPPPFLTLDGERYEVRKA